MPFTSQNSIQQGVPSNLSLIVFLPAAGALAIALLWENWSEQPLRFSALGVTLATFSLSLLLPAFFQNGTSDMQFVERAPWIPPLGASYHLGIDGISIWLVCLTTFLLVLIVLFSWTLMSTVSEIEVRRRTPTSARQNLRAEVESVFVRERPSYLSFATVNAGRQIGSCRSWRSSGHQHGIGIRGRTPKSARTP